MTEVEAVGAFGALLLASVGVGEGLRRIGWRSESTRRVVHMLVGLSTAAAPFWFDRPRGIALLAPAEAGLAVGEYAPNAVKKTVVGVGHAGKEQVQHMVRVQLPGVAFAGPDAADALAIAIFHAHHLQGRVLRIASPRQGVA